MRSRRRLFTGVAVFFSLVILLPLLPYAFAQKDPDAIPVPSPGVGFWQDVRGGAAGNTMVLGPEAGVLINEAGERWRQLRIEKITRYSGWALGGLVVAIALFYGIKGSLRIEGGRSGRTVPRWTLFERVLHWFTAVLFIILALTGLSLLFGRYVLIPFLGPDGFGAFAYAAKNIHNYLGPVFSVGVLVMIPVWLISNLPERTDFAWLAKGGGYIGDTHPHCGKINAGEKIMVYWLMVTVGVVAILSGLVLDFPIFGQTREQMALATTVHAISTVIWMFFAIGHIFMGSLAVEGALEGMWRGRVDANWAKQHHDLWYAKVKHLEESAAESGQPSGAPKEQLT